MGAELFDNRRLLEEGTPAAPKFTSCLPPYVERSADRSIYQQKWDEK
jgi:hypothetical protein